jgi:hypothetical protein
VYYDFVQIACDKVSSSTGVTVDKCTTTGVDLFWDWFTVIMVCHNTIPLLAQSGT